MDPDQETLNPQAEGVSLKKLNEWHSASSTLKVTT
jgi:hypothetical protein